MIDRRRVLAGAAGLAALVAARPARAQLFDAPRPDLWPRWTAHDATSGATVDHGAWDAVLAAHLRPGADGIARFDYSAALADRAGIDRYVQALAATPVSRFARPEQFAYWVNLYNALTVQVVLDHYPVASIRDIDISPGLFANGPWGAERVTVEGEGLTLDDIEHRILRPIWQDPRIHYAVNCAALGCPNLHPVAFTGANTERLLDAGARAFVNHARGARMGRNGLFVSSIYVWFDEDFGGTDAGVIAHLRRYAEPALAASLAGVDDIADDGYDWALNDGRAGPLD